jgi:hypothetical protein
MLSKNQYCAPNIPRQKGGSEEAHPVLRHRHHTPYFVAVILLTHKTVFLILPHEKGSFYQIINDITGLVCIIFDKE